MNPAAILARPLRAVAEVLLPPACLACHAALGPRPAERRDIAGELLCRDCREWLRPLDRARCCPRCGAHPAHRIPGKTPPGRCRDCEALPASFEEARSAFPYKSPAGEIVRNLKYRRSPYLAEWLVRLSVPAVGAWLHKAASDATVAFVPMTPGRQTRRGYNQAEELARALAALYGRPLLPDGALIRVAHHAPQARFANRPDRRAAPRGCFRVRRPDSVSGRKLLLVDDVITTGSTVATVAELLREEGGGPVFIFSPVRAKLSEDSEVRTPGRGGAEPLA